MHGCTMMQQPGAQFPPANRSLGDEYKAINHPAAACAARPKSLGQGESLWTPPSHVIADPDGARTTLSLTHSTCSSSIIFFSIAHTRTYYYYSSSNSFTFALRQHCPAILPLQCTSPSPRAAAFPFFLTVRLTMLQARFDRAPSPPMRMVASSTP